MSLFDKDLASVTAEDVLDFCRQGISENVRVEYKREASAKSANKQIAKEVSAMANTQGGIILFGIAEDEERKPILPFTGIPSSDGLAQTIKTICLDSIYPLIVPEVQECPIDGGKSVVVIVRVKESDETPHSINGRTEWYIRANDISQPRQATEDELQWLFSRRAKSIDLRERLIAKARSRFDVIDRDASVPFFILSCVPSFPSQALFSLKDLAKISSAVRGNWDTPLGIGDQISAADAIISKGWDKKKTTESPGFNEFYFTQLDVFGLAYHAAHMQLIQSNGREGINQYAIVAWLRVLLEWMGGVYREAGYFGLLDVTIELNGIQGKALFQKDGLGFHSASGRAEFDSKLYLKRTVSPEKLTSTNDPKFGLDSLLVDFLRDIRWAFGYGDRALNFNELAAAVAASRR